MTIQERIKKVAIDANIKSVADGEITSLKEYDGFILFNVDGKKTTWSVNLTKTGKIRKGSLRIYSY